MEVSQAPLPPTPGEGAAGGVERAGCSPEGRTAVGEWGEVGGS